MPASPLCDNPLGEDFRYQRLGCRRAGHVANTDGLGPPQARRRWNLAHPGVRALFP